MNYRRLGKTNLNISEISLGTWQLGGGWGQPFDDHKAQAVLDAAVDQGINFLDTADVYSDRQSERKVGQFVGQRREQLYIGTKIGRRISPHVVEGYTPEILSSYVDEALANTGLEYLDLVQLHCPPTGVYFRDELFEQLQVIRDSGKVRHFGVSVEKVEEAIQASQYDIVESVQIIFNMFRVKPLDECFRKLKEKDIGVIVRVPLASGLLTGKMTPETEFVKDDHRFFNRNGEVFDKGETFSGVPLEAGFAAVDALTEHFDRSRLNQFALRWVLMFDEVSTVIPGASRLEQVADNVTAATLAAFTEAEMQVVSDVYDRFIRSHVHQNW
ncbi:MAG: aldo/keto reductase [Bacteroidota bacterium]